MVNISVYKKYGIYGIKNKLNNKIYIGKTMKSFGDRWDCHKAQLNGGYHDNPHLQNAWNKYGSNNFEFTILYDCTGKDNDFVNKLEISEISKYKKLHLSYNIHQGGEGGLFLGKHLSPEAKKKIGDKNRIHMTGKVLSKETRQKMSDSHNKRYSLWSDDDRKKWGEMISHKASGYCWTEEQKAKLRGNKNGAILDINQVKQIRKLHEIDNLGYTEIANIMNLKRYTVYLVATYRRWKDV